MKYLLPAALFGIIIVMLPLFNSCHTVNALGYYKGRPYSDSLYKNGAQVIPGKIQCEYYDMGGEGIAYHDNDSINSGSGKLNPSDGSYLNEFRVNEYVDISYTKSRGIDDHDYNLVKPELNQL